MQTPRSSMLDVTTAGLVIGLVLLRFARKTGVVWLGVLSLALLVMRPRSPSTP